MSTLGQVVFDRSASNHDEIWDDTELIQAYDEAHRQVQRCLRPDATTPANDSPSTTRKANRRNNTKRSRTTIEQQQPPVVEHSHVSNFPTPIPLNLITPPKNEQDALHSMLMSWYMAGYHAGQLAAAKNLQMKEKN